MRSKQVDLNAQLYRLASSIRLFVVLKKTYDQFLNVLYFFLRKIKKYLGYNFSLPTQTSMIFCIMCVKRPEYVDLAIRNINTLHFQNSTHKVVVFVDSVCEKAMIKQSHWLDYPDNVGISRITVDSSQPWQLSKVEAVVQASKMGAALVDADTIWYADPAPLLKTTKITFLVKAYAVAEMKREKLLVEKIFLKPDWTKFDHFVTGFVHIPSKMITPKLASVMRKNAQIILNDRLAYIHSNREKLELRRLAEEIGIGLAVQSVYLKSKIQTLKDADGPGNKKIMQSLYYGCTNQFTE